MMKADSDALRKRLELADWDASIEDVLRLIVREVDRAVRRERARVLPTAVTGRWVDQRWVPPVNGRRKQGYWLVTVQTTKGKRR
jgi:hypothetical protein